MNVNAGLRVYNKVQTTGNIQEQEGQIRLCQGTSNRALELHFFGWMKKTNLYQNDGKRKAWRRKGTVDDPKHHIVCQT